MDSVAVGGTAVFGNSLERKWSLLRNYPWDIMIWLATVRINLWRRHWKLTMTPRQAFLGVG
jgi:hypothetical protein